jgi:hypothetical protein
LTAFYPGNQVQLFLGTADMFDDQIHMVIAGLTLDQARLDSLIVRENDQLFAGDLLLKQTKSYRNCEAFQLKDDGLLVLSANGRD